MSLKETRKRGGRTLLSIVVIAVAVYIGFEPLITNVPDGVAKSVISSSFGAIFVIILTMYLLNKQTEIEQESKKSERVFDEKVRLFREIMDITRDMLIDGKISREEVNRLPFPLIRLQMLAKDETIKSFSLVNQKLNEIYAEDEMEEVVISEEEKNELFKALSSFASQCRLDLGIADRDVEEELVTMAVETISNTGKKGRDYTKFSFDGKDYPKNRYIWEVLSSFVKENPNTDLSGFENIFPRDGGEEFKLAGIKKGGTYETWKLYDEAQEVFDRTGYKRFHVCSKGKDYKIDKDMVLKLTNAEICISSQWASDQMEPFIKRMKSKGIKTS
ncbi:MAG: hypothetical protein CML84_07810 [Rhodobiaceae bacterium]|jgi:hypothetical protein|nr:hypothetical protein [Rhodobiaceae bacterium]|tara:strand:+ start:3462 stop:4454 length:993 start_codon:yes stop_codon:yes gene_type:complete